MTKSESQDTSKEKLKPENVTEFKSPHTTTQATKLKFPLKMKTSQHCSTSPIRESSTQPTPIAATSVNVGAKEKESVESQSKNGLFTTPRNMISSDTSNYCHQVQTHRSRIECYVTKSSADDVMSDECVVVSNGRNVTVMYPNTQACFKIISSSTDTTGQDQVWAS